MLVPSKAKCHTTVAITKVGLTPDHVSTIKRYKIHFTTYDYILLSMESSTIHRMTTFAVVNNTVNNENPDGNAKLLEPDWLPNTLHKPYYSI